MKVAFAFVSGLIFSLGLVISQMINPAKVIGFLDVSGEWDPSLLLVMGSALVVTMAGYKLVFGRQQPMLDEGFHLPVNRVVDHRLLVGAALFGVGWGLAGFCPGPALSSLVLGDMQTVSFIAAMMVGMITKKVTFN